MRLLRWVQIVCFLNVLVLFSSQVVAGSFKVFPLRLDLDQSRKTALFKIMNTGDQPVTVQLESAVWYQDEAGEDQYQSTKDVVYFPKIVSVGPGEERIVRIGYRGAPARNVQKSYRIFAQELPEQSEASGAVSFALRFSVPVFIMGTNTAPKPKMVNAELKNGLVRVMMENTGTEHYIVKSVSVKGKAQNGSEVFTEAIGGWYVLPTVKRPFSLGLSADACGKSSVLEITVDVASKAFKQSIPVKSSECIMVENTEKDVISGKR